MTMGRVTRLVHLVYKVRTPSDPKILAIKFKISQKCLTQNVLSVNNGLLNHDGGREKSLAIFFYASAK